MTSPICRLSVNINKIATLRNSRGGQHPNVLQAAINCQRFGADGITIHPRPDERHIRYDDARAIHAVITTEYNIEGNPKEEKFVRLIEELRPTQVTLVPDGLHQLTSDHGWDTVQEAPYLKEIVPHFQNLGCRVSLFVNPDLKMIDGAAALGTDRIELYTEQYARQYLQDSQAAVAPYRKAAEYAHLLGLGINAGHDLDLKNLRFLAAQIPMLQEVSIGHALISDALYYGLQNVIQMYKRLLLR